MLGILLMILKIIGIILLIVLAIVVAVLGILLFVPVRYRFYGCFRENCRVAEGKITWLMHIVSCPFFLTGENPGIQFRIFGKKVDLEKRKQGRKKQKKQKSRTEYKTAKTSAPEAKERLKSTISSQHKETLQIQEISGPPQNTEELQEKTGKLLHELITEYGLDGFKKIEEDINAGISCQRSVIAPGGSVVYGEKAMKHFKEIGKVVYLKISYEELEGRLGNLQSRGVALKEGQTLLDLYHERVPYYEKYADITIEEQGLGVEETINRIAKELGLNS